MSVATITVHADGTQQSAPITIGGANTTIYEHDPAQGQVLPGQQACMIAKGQGYDSVTIVPSAGPVGGKRAAYLFRGRQPNTLSGLTPTINCVPHTGACDISALDGNAIWQPPSAAQIAAGQDTFFYRTSFYFPPNFPDVAQGGLQHFNIHELFGPPFGSSGGGPIVGVSGFGSGGTLVLNGLCTNDDGSSPTSQIFYTFGALTGNSLRDKWVDIVFEVRINTVSQSGTRWFGNHDGHLKMWLSVNQSPTFQLGPVARLRSTTQQFGAQDSNLDPNNRLKIISANPGGAANPAGQASGYSWPVAFSDKTGHMYFYCQTYAGANSTASPPLDYDFYFGRQRAAYDLASLLA